MIAKKTGIGSWRTHLQVPAEQVTKVENKEGVTAKQVGTVSVNPVTAWRLLRGFVDVGEGGWYIQNGANSGVGRAVTQLGRLWGMRGIVVIRAREDEGEEGRLREEMRALGAEKVVTDKEVAEKGFRDRVMEWTNGGREEVRLGLNCVGGEAGMAMARVLGKGASLVTYGAMSKAPMRVGAGMLIFQDLRFQGFWVSRWSERFPEEKKRTVEEILGLYREDKFVDVPSVDVPWNLDTKKEELVEAVQGTLEGYRKGKGIFVFGDT